MNAGVFMVPTSAQCVDVGHPRGAGAPCAPVGQCLPYCCTWGYVTGTPPCPCGTLPASVRTFEKAPPEVQEILSKPIQQLGLKLEGSPLERFVQQLYKELDAKGLKKFRPRCYLTDEWGCPNMEPVIGIPFYLADPKLQRLELEMNDLEDSRQIMMYLRHEAGHAFNYAYELYKTQEWRELFGPFRRPYRDAYKPVPFSRQYVRHMEGWYAQKHPDEDFAETFAVWLTPRSNWRKRYEGWGALRKLKYMERVARKVRELEPLRAQGDTDITVDEMEVTVGEFYEKALDQELTPGDLPLEADLVDIFNVSKRRRKNVRPAADLLRENRKLLVDKVNYWTGAQRPLVRKLIEAIEQKTEELGLKADTKHERGYLTEITVYATTLAMNYITRGKFVLP
jgi:Putative zinc-binding metallo-peptidase